MDICLKANKIFHGDCVEVLKTLPDCSVDLVIADPPYNSPLIEWDGKNNEWQVLWLEEVKRVIKEGASLYVFFAPMNMFGVEKWIRENLVLKNIGVWNHPNLYSAGMAYGKDRFKSAWDVVFYAVKGKKTKHGNNVSSVAFSLCRRGIDVFTYPQSRPLLHRAQKPIDLVELFIKCSSNSGDVVLDPFLGAGTTALACVRTSRYYVGIELEQKFIDIARTRLDGITTLRKTDIEIWRELKRTTGVEEINKPGVGFVY